MNYKDLNPKLAGIYIITNTVNNKSYVGQSVSLRSRIKDHFRNMKNQKLDLPLYRATAKYGIHNFKIDILESFIPDNLTDEELIRKLDELEIKYIAEYNTYLDGYNCTKGGDYGVLGLKMTEAQRNKVSANTKKLVSSGVLGKRVFLYNCKERYYIYAWTIKDASNITKVSKGVISKLCNNKLKISSNFIAAFSSRELESKKNNYLEDIKKYYESNNRGKFTKGTGNKNWFKGMVSLNKGKKMSSVQKEKIRNTLSKNYIYQYDNNKLLNIFNTTEEAARTVNGKACTIRCACNGKQKTAYGYIWKYRSKEEITKE